MQKAINLQTKKIWSFLRRRVSVKNICHYQSAPLKPYDGAIFEGWDQPIKCDTENHGSLNCPSVMRGNACYNFIGKIEDIRNWIDNNQLNLSFDKSRVVAIDPDRLNLCGDSPETVVYPELVVPGNHAVIDGLMSKTK